jgi:hypothetical protein
VTIFERRMSTSDWRFMRVDFQPNDESESPSQFDIQTSTFDYPGGTLPS